MNIIKDGKMATCTKGQWSVMKAAGWEDAQNREVEVKESRDALAEDKQTKINEALVSKGARAFLCDKFDNPVGARKYFI